MRLSDGQKVVMAGDSITDAGRRDLDPPYGTGYMTLVRSFVTASHPELHLTWENRGVGGDTVRHLAERWVHDVLDEKPDVLTVMIGINDVWRRFGDTPLEAVPADEYQSTLATLLRSVNETIQAQTFIGSPYMIEANKSNPMREAMDLYGGLAREVANDVDATFIDVQAAFDLVLQYTESVDWADDQIHPNQPGHAVIALEYLKAFGIDMTL